MEKMHNKIAKEEVVGPATRPLDGAVDGVFELIEPSKKVDIAAKTVPDEQDVTDTLPDLGNEPAKPRSRIRSFAVLAGLFVRSLPCTLLY